MHSFLRHADTV